MVCWVRPNLRIYATYKFRRFLAIFRRNLAKNRQNLLKNPGLLSYTYMTVLSKSSNTHGPIFMILFCSIRNGIFWAWNFEPAIKTHRKLFCNNMFILSLKENLFFKYVHIVIIVFFCQNEQKKWKQIKKE